MSESGAARLAVVTGGSRGIGLELARELRRRGFELVIAGRSRRVEEVAEELGAEAVRVDLTTDAGVEQLWQRVRARGRAPDVVALNAGCGVGGAFAESELALRNELRGSGVTVTVLMPGPTDTDFFVRNGMDDTRIAGGSKDDPADVARDALDGLLEGRERVVSASLLTKLQQAGTKVLPDAVKAGLVRHMAKPGTARD